MKVKTLGPVQHDGKPVKVGATLDLPEDAATQLIDAGAAEAVGGDKAASTAKTDNGGDGQ
jgi:hypothetical protein